MTPAERLEQELEIAELLAEHEPIAYFRTGSAARWLLAIAQGLQVIGAYAVLTEAGSGP